MPSRITRPQVKGYKGKLKSSAHTARSVPVVSHEGDVLTLHFGSDFIQSQMLVGDPGFLAFAYTRTMMSFEWFMPQPREIAIHRAWRRLHRQVVPPPSSTIQADGCRNQSSCHRGT